MDRWSTRGVCSVTIAIGRGLAVAAVAMMVLAQGALVRAQGPDRMELGPRQFEVDDTGHGAVLCSWSIYLSLRTMTATCGWLRAPIDEVMDEVIGAMDAFILANSSLRPTRAALDDFKRRVAAAEAVEMRKKGLGRVCDRPDLQEMRYRSADEIRASVKKLLALPREPVMNPCL